MELFTIGHSNQSIEGFLFLPEKHGITAVADVRSHPFSRYLPFQLSLFDLNFEVTQKTID